MCFYANTTIQRRNCPIQIFNGDMSLNWFYKRRSFLNMLNTVHFTLINIVLNEAASLFFYDEECDM